MKNVKLSYIISFLHYSWFWIGIWVIYYSSFGGNYAVGVLETVMIVTTILAEIPTGAIGDLLGKRKTLFLGFIMLGVSNIWMAYAPNLLHMCLSLVLMNVGGAFISGTFNALIYDSLKEEKKTILYHRVLSNITSITLFAFAICSVIGGYIAQYDIRMPFALNGVGIFIAAILSLFLKEPSVDSEQFTIKSYINQNIKGIKHLFRNINVRKIVVPLLFISSVMYILRQGLDDILMLDFGFKDKPFVLSIITAVMFLTASLASHYYPKLVKGYRKYSSFVILIIITVVTLLISPITVLYFGAGTVLIRSMIAPILETFTSYRINRVIESKYRATALSTFSMIQGIPYALLILLVTSITDIIPSQYVALFFGIILSIAIFLFRKRDNLSVTK